MSAFARALAAEDARGLTVTIRLEVGTAALGAACVDDRPDWEAILEELARERAAMDRLGLGSARARVLQRRKGLFKRLADRWKVRRRNAIQGQAAKIVDQPQSIRITVRHGAQGGVQKQFSRKKTPAEIELILRKGSQAGVLTIKAPLKAGDDLVLTFDHAFDRAGETRQGGVLGLIHRLFSCVRRRKPEAESWASESFCVAKPSSTGRTV